MFVPVNGLRRRLCLDQQSWFTLIPVDNNNSLYEHKNNFVIPPLASDWPSFVGTRNSAIADKPRDAFSGQSKSPNIVPFDVRYGFLLVWYSNFVSKTHRFSDTRLQKCRDLENRVRGPSRSLKMSPFDRAHMTSYWRSIVTTTCVLCRFWDIHCRKMSWPWNPDQRPLKVIESGTIW